MGITDTTPTIFDPATGRIYSFLNEENLCFFDKVTFDVLQKYGRISADAVVLPFIEARARASQADRAKYCTGARRVTAERADEALNCLPPFRWRATQGMEAFAISEPVTDRILTWFVRLGSQWFELHEDRAISYDDLVGVVKDSMGMQGHD
jgi:hypothetical protein